jgi:signal transduction histidine kinase
LAAGLLAIGLAALGTWLAVADDVPDGNPWWVSNLVMAVDLTAIGVLIALRDRRHPVGWLFLVGGLAQATTQAARSWALHTSVVLPGSLPGLPWAGWFGTWPPVLALGTFPLLLMVFPDGRLPSRRWRAACILTIGVVALAVVCSATWPGPITDALPGVDNPVGVGGPVMRVIESVSNVANLLIIPVAFGALATKFRRSGPDARAQIKWVLWGAALVAAELVLELTPWAADSVLAWVGPLVTTLFAAAVAVAMLKYRLYDIDLVISRTIIYAVLTAMASGLYIGVVLAVGHLFGQRVDLGPALAAALIVSLLFAPLRQLVQRAVERLLYGDRADPYRALSRLGQRVGESGAAPTVLAEVADAVAQALRLEHVAILSTGGERLAEIGEARTPPLTQPLLFRTAPVGQLVVSAGPGARLSAADLRLLTDLARHVAAVVQAVQTSEALAESRSEIVAAREEERRRIRQNLHDGLGPTLAAIGMKLGAARYLIAEAPTEASAVLAQLGGEIRDTIDEIRRLVYDLRPPVLDELGLVEAVRGQVTAFDRWTQHGAVLNVRLDAPERVSDLAAATEVAAYRIAGEALANVARHARANQCAVRLAVDDSTLLLVVDDDGAGIAPDAGRGVGLRSMAERAAEIGGTLDIGRSPWGGARITARLPLHPDTGVRPAAPQADSDAPRFAAVEGVLT